jgi:ParB family chromosome partitioning protein
VTGKRLGRGLDALLTRGERTEVVAPEPHTGISGVQRMIGVHEVHRSPYQPRRAFDETAIAELAESLKSQGLLQPIVVRERAGGGYELIAGERRWRAAQVAQMDRIPALIRHASDKEASALALIENIQRENLKPLEEAQALVRLRDEFGLTHEQVAESVGKSRTAVTNLMRLLNLSVGARQLLEAGELEAGHARALLGLPGDQQDAAAHWIVDKRMSVRQAEALVKRWLEPRPAVEGKSQKDADTRLLERDLTERVGAPVSIDHQRSGKGVVSIRYNSLEELDGILSHLR